MKKFLLFSALLLIAWGAIVLLVNREAGAADSVWGSYTYTGSGANLTALNASSISSGSLADGRLSANVPLLNAANVFSVGQSGTTFTASTTPGGFAGDGNSLTNLNPLWKTNALGNGVVAVNQILMTNVSAGNITLAGISGTTSGLGFQAMCYATNSGATDRTVTLMGGCVSTDGSRSYTTTNKQTRQFSFWGIAGIYTNCASVPGF